MNLIKGVLLFVRLILGGVGIYLLFGFLYWLLLIVGISAIPLWRYFYLLSASLYFLYCIIACTGILRGKVLLVSAIAMEGVFVSAVIWECFQDQIYIKSINNLVLMVLLLPVLSAAVYFGQSRTANH